MPALLLITREKSFCKTSFQVGMDLEKVQKQGRDERTQEEIPYICKIHSRCRVVFLLFSSLPCFCSFQVHSYLKWSFAETFFLSFWFFFWRVSKPAFKQKMNALRIGDEHFSARDACLNFRHTHTASSVWACACVTSKQTLSYTCIYAVAFSVGLKYVLGEKTAGKTWIIFPFYMRS